jgi:tetratricopeptide (TPR) repeat protein
VGLGPPFFLDKGKVMADLKTQQFQQLLGQLFVEINNHDTAVLGKIQTLLIKIPEEPNLLHLAGLASADQNKLSAAIDYLSRSLSRQFKQPEVHNNLANMYVKQGNETLAEQHYRQALQLNSNFQDARKNLGLLLIPVNPEAAFIELDRAVALNSSDIGALTGLGDAHKAMENFEEAKECYQLALEINPDHVTARHNLALCYKLNEQLDLATESYQLALNLAPRSAEIHYNYANALFESGEHDQAEFEYLKSLEHNPEFVIAHETLHEFYWQAGQHEKLELSYQKAITQTPRDIALRLSYISMLSAIGRGETAQQQLNEALSIETTAALLHAQGRLAADQLDYSRALIAFTKALGKTFDLGIAQDLVRLHITQANYDLAQAVLDRLMTFAPMNQLTWALQGLCWRLLGDERYHWLIDHENHIGVFTLPVPPGYRSLADFLAELESVLLGMHKAQVAPSQQTLKSGTQTPGRLLHKRNPVIASYRESLEQVVESYLQRFSPDENHPFLKRLSVVTNSQFNFSGSWSVKLKPQGFHVNHVHPEGWISSASYISLPYTMANQTNHSGCIKFGESALMLGEREVVERIIRPVAGQLVLFPSYTWHGTYAFEGESSEFRLTAPFDVVPA